MSIRYIDIARFVALRADLIADGDSAAREAAYSAANLEAQTDSPNVPYSALKHDILAREAELVEMIGNSSNAIYRSALQQQSGLLASGDGVPLTGNIGDFYGAFDAVVDSGTGLPLREMPLQTVLRRIANPNDTFKLAVGYYAREGTEIYHTATNVRIRGVGWDRDAQDAAFDVAPTEPADRTFGTANVSTVNETITVTAHGYWTGLKCRLLKGAGSLPTPLAVDTNYWIIRDTVDTVKLAYTYADAVAGSAINLTATGGNGNTISIVAASGGGISPLPASLAVIWGAMVLASLPQERWFVNEAQYWQNVVRERLADIISGRAQLMSAPDIPIKTASVDPVAG